MITHKPINPDDWEKLAQELRPKPVGEIAGFPVLTSPIVPEGEIWIVPPARLTSLGQLADMEAKLRALGIIPFGGWNRDDE